ncbi:MAG: hypothetical protein ACOY3Y_12225 [Acidobacteriota bacterium]
MFARRPLLAHAGLAAALTLAANNAGAALAINVAFFPGISNKAGLGGSRWQSEVAVTNFHDHNLTIFFQVSMNGGVLSKPRVLAPRETVTWDNYLQEEWGIEGNGALVLSALPVDNGGMQDECLSFSASVRTKNVGGVGTFGQEIGPATITEWLEQNLAYFDGVRHFGTPGVSGIRTNIGLWSFDTRQSVDLDVTLYDKGGAKVWQRTMQARRHEMTITTLPSDVQIDGGVLVVNPLAQSVDVVPFISVVDNVTGDGLQRYALIELATQVAQCGVGLLSKGLNGPDPGRAASWARLVERVSIREAR